VRIAVSKRATTPKGTFFSGSPSLSHMSDARSELRSQLLSAVSKADYPVGGKLDLLPVLPDGPTTTFEVGDDTVTAMQLATAIGGRADFPYDTPEALVGDILDALEDEGDI
jgi:hypothetical protein